MRRHIFILGICMVLTGCASLRAQFGRRSSMLILEATGYCSCGACCGWHRDANGVAVDNATGLPKQVGITASGKRARRSTIAADTERFPFGTVMYVEGYGYGTVEDRGGDIRGDRIDLHFLTHDDALRWGRKRVRVRIVSCPKKK